MPQLQTIRQSSVWWRGVVACSTVMLLISGHVLQAMPASSPTFPVPKTLQPNIKFWIRVFSEIDENGGFLHDPDDLAIIYHTFTDLPLDRQIREEHIDQYRQYYSTILEALARGKRQALTRDEQRVLGMFQHAPTASAFRTAADKLRFQGGIRNRFAAGLLRSVAYLPEIERVFSAEGLPKELTLLPHVESSFSNKAYSKVGAAGLWQIMPATGRRFLTVNDRVDERVDIRKASRAAAKILQENYQMLGTWPLAITAYNHGANGMKRAVEAMGTTDIGVIAQQYDGPSFGFASRNFYAEFLAAVHVVRHADHYFGNLRGFVAPPTTNTAMTTPPPPSPQQTELRKYQVQKGDTLTAIARRFNVAVTTLAQLNHIDRRHHVQAGQMLVVPGGATPRQQVARQVQTSPAKAVERPVSLTQRSVGTAPSSKTPAAKKAEPQKERGKQAGGSTRLARASVRTRPGSQTSQQASKQQASKGTTTRSAAKQTAVAPKTSKETKNQVTRRKQYRVRRGESLTTIADRMGTSVQTLATLNKLRPPYHLRPGQELTIAVPAVARYYQVRPGDTLTDIATRFSTTPSTLVDMNDLDSPEVIHPGQMLLVPPAEPQAGLFQDAFSQDVG